MEYINMGIGMAVMGGLTLASMAGSISQARSQAHSKQQEANLKLENKAQQVKALAGKQKVDFLGSGIAIEKGATSGQVISGTYETGLQDIEQLRSIYQADIKNTINQGIFSALKTGAGSAASMGLGAPTGAAPTGAAPTGTGV